MGACLRKGWEGVIAKRRDSVYEHRRSPNWLKMKCEASQELVVGGFTDPQGARVGLGALLVGYFEATTSSSPARWAQASTPSCCSTFAPGSIARDRQASVHQGDRAAAPSRALGDDPRSSCRSPSPNGPCTTSFAIHDCWAFARTSGSRSGQGAAVITHPDKVLFPDDGITKGALAAYYEAIASIMLPHIRGRPITMERFPSGIGRKGFIQKDVSKGFPHGWSVSRCRRRMARSPSVVEDARSLLWLANQNCITPHVWTSRAPDLYTPISASSTLTRRGTIQTHFAVRRSRCAICWTSSASKLGQDLRLERLSHRRPSRRQGRLRCRPRFREYRWHRARVARSETTDAGVQQGRPRRPHPGGHRTKRIQRDVRGALRRSRQAGRTDICAVHVGRSREGEVHPQTFTIRTIADRIDAVGDLWSDMRAYIVSGKLAAIAIVRRTTMRLETANRGKAVKGSDPFTVGAWTWRLSITSS